MTTNTTFRFH